MSKVAEYAKSISGIETESTGTHEILLTYLGHNIEMAGPRAIMLNLSFALFNYMPYMSKVAFVKNYKRTDGLIERDSVGLCPNPLAVFRCEYSNAFYEFYAKEFISREARAMLSGNSLDTYSHVYSNTNIDFVYSEYIELPKEHVSDEDLKKALEKSKASGMRNGRMVLGLQN
jgi:hypothetical protein